MSSALFVVICCLKRKVEELEIFSFIFFRLEQLLFLPSATETPRGYFQVIGQWGCAAGCTFSSTIYQSLNIMGWGGRSETQAAYTQKNLIILPPPPPPHQTRARHAFEVSATWWNNISWPAFPDPSLLAHYVSFTRICRKSKTATDVLISRYCW